LIYELSGAAFNTLDAFSYGGDKREQLVFALGASEIRATLGANGQIEFDNLEHLLTLDPEDMLSLRLYSNNDTANILWEFAFGINGLHVDYQIASALNPISLDQTNPMRPMVKTLGGMRLKYRYQPPAGETITSLTWHFRHAGWFCTGPWVELDRPDTGPHQCQYRDSNSQYVQSADDDNDNVNGWAVWWEPADTTAAGLPVLWETDMGGAIGGFLASYESETQNVTTQQAQQRNAEFLISTREINPTITPMLQGPDVEILEAVLWHLGLSPQSGHPGVEGNRINSARGGNQWTNKCSDGTRASRRNEYTSGWTACARNNVALEGMVRRLQGRTLATCDRGGAGCANHYAGISNLSDGVVGNATLGIIKMLWQEYADAYSSHQGSPVINNALAGWLTNGVVLWDGGGVNALPATYTAAEHNNMLAAADNQPATFTRENLLDSWVQQEAGVGHWGRGHPQTSYRVSEGGADEFGSIGMVIPPKFSRSHK